MRKWLGPQSLNHGRPEPFLRSKSNEHKAIQTQVREYTVRIGSGMADADVGDEVREIFWFILAFVSLILANCHDDPVLRAVYFTIGLSCIILGKLHEEKK